MEMGGAGTFVQNSTGGQYKMGGGIYLDRKIRVFPGGVPVNFGHSLRGISRYFFNQIKILFPTFYG